MAALLPLLLFIDGIAAFTNVTLQCAFIAMSFFTHSNRVRRSDALERVRIPHSVLFAMRRVNQRIMDAPSAVEAVVEGVFTVDPLSLRLVDTQLF